MGKRRHEPACFGAAALSRALAVASLFRVTGVGAQQPEPTERYRLHWVREGGAESCASGAALARLLEQVLGSRPAAAGSTPVLLEGVAKVAPAPLRFAVRVAVRDAASNEIIGERELTTADEQCSALTPALLLVLAMSVDPDAGRDGMPPAVTEELRRTREEDVDTWPATPAPAASPTARATPAAREATVSPVARPAAVAAAASPESPAPSDPQLQVFAALAASTGILPALAPGAALGLTLPLRRGFSSSLAVFGWNPQTVELPSSAFLEASGVDVAASQLSAELCRSLLGARLELAACGGFDLGLRWVKAHALPNEDNPTRAFFGPELALRGGWRLGSSWVLGAGAAAQAQLRRDRFTYQDHDGHPHVWFEPSWISSRFWLSVGALP